MGREVASDMLPRVAAAGEACRDAWDAYQARRELRDALIVRAVDDGITQTAIARAAQVAPSRIAAILASSQPEHVA